MTDKPKKSISRSIGEFFGHIAHGIKADVKPAGDGQKQEIKRTVEEETRETPEGKITLRRTTIEEVEVKKPESETRP